MSVTRLILLSEGLEGYIFNKVAGMDAKPGYDYSNSFNHNRKETFFIFAII
jgi:hypothetical protein